MTFTYSQQVNTTTVSPGWNGTSLAVTLRLRDGNLLGRGNNGDTVDIQRTGSSVNLGTVNLKQNYAKSKKTVVFNATMTAATATVNGVRTVSASSAMVWSPLAAVTNLTGRPSSTAPVPESGPLDREF